MIASKFHVFSYLLSSFQTEVLNQVMFSVSGVLQMVNQAMFLSGNGMGICYS